MSVIDSDAIPYIKTAELPELRIDWLDGDGNVIDLSNVGYAFELKIGYRGQSALLTKTTGITGFATLPNVRVVWGAGELAMLQANRYILQLRATLNLQDRLVQAEIGIINPVL